MMNDIIVGVHSIKAAIENSNRSDFELHGTAQSLQLIDKSLREKCEVSKLAIKDLDSLYQSKCYELGFKAKRVPSSLFLVCSSLEVKTLHNIWKQMDTGVVKMIALDQVTDVHNAAAIMRTASFYGIDAVIIPQKGGAKLTPNFFRIASGATESVDIIQSPSLSKTINKLQDKDVTCVGFSEHEKEVFSIDQLNNSEQSFCLVFGSEDNGLSNAVKINLKHLVSLKSRGFIKSLNVSVAVSVALEKLFS